MLNILIIIHNICYCNRYNLCCETISIMFRSMRFFLEGSSVTEIIECLLLLGISFNVSYAFFILGSFIGEIQSHILDFFNGSMSF